MTHLTPITRSPFRTSLLSTICYVNWLFIRTITIVNSLIGCFANTTNSSRPNATIASSRTRWPTTCSPNESITLIQRRRKIWFYFSLLIRNVINGQRSDLRLSIMIRINSRCRWFCCSGGCWCRRCWCNWINSSIRICGLTIRPWSTLIGRIITIVVSIVIIVIVDSIWIGFFWI